jgi:hypothetical protein
MEGGDHIVDAYHWSRTHNVDVDEVLLTLAGYRREKIDLEALRARPEVEGD